MVYVWAERVPGMQEAVFHKRIHYCGRRVALTDEKTDVVNRVQGEINVVQPELIGREFTYFLIDRLARVPRKWSIQQRPQFLTMLGHEITSASEVDIIEVLDDRENGLQLPRRPHRLQLTIVNDGCHDDSNCRDRRRDSRRE